MVLLFCYHPAPVAKAKAAAVPVVNTNELILEASSPEMAQLIDDYKTRRLALDEQETRLNALAAQLKNEIAEIAAVTQAVLQVQQRFNSNVMVYKQAQEANLKKLSKTFLSQGPQSAAQNFKTMDDDTIAKVLRLMKEADSALFLDAMTKAGPDTAKRVGHVVERMRVAVDESSLLAPVTNFPALPTSASTNVPAVPATNSTPKAP